MSEKTKEAKQKIAAYAGLIIDGSEQKYSYGALLGRLFHRGLNGSHNEMALGGKVAGMLADILDSSTLSQPTEDKPCPYVHTSKDGTSYCALAEKSARAVSVDGFDYLRVREWMLSSPRKSANQSFTAGAERNVAYLIEEYDSAKPKEATK